MSKTLAMNQGKMVFAQLMEFAPYHVFKYCVKRYDGGLLPERHVNFVVRAKRNIDCKILLPM